MTLDADLVRRRCQIAESIERLECIRAAGRDEFLARADARDIAHGTGGLCRLLRLHGEGRCDRCRPSQRLQLMAWFRNLLVHVYWTIDYRRVFGVLERDVDDLRDFSRIVASLV